MEKLLSKEIEDKLNKIVDIIETSDEYKEYLYLKEKMEKHSKINNIVSEIKALQKKIVRMEIMLENTIELEERLKELEKQLLEIPLYNDFLTVQKNLDETFQEIKQTIERLFEF